MNMFKLNEEKARLWLAMQVDEPDEADVVIEDGWSPRYDVAGDNAASESDIWTLVHYANEAALFDLVDRPGTAPQIVYVYDGDGDGGGVFWIVEVVSEGGTLKLASRLSRRASLGHPEASGIDAALAVLEEAVEGANDAFGRLESFLRAEGYTS